MMPGNHRLKDFAEPRLECGDGAGFVQLHQSAVADHIGGQDCGETALGALFGHVAPLLPACAQIRLYWRHAGESMAPDFWNGSFASIRGEGGEDCSTPHSRTRRPWGPVYPSYYRTTPRVRKRVFDAERRESNRPSPRRERRTAASRPARPGGLAW